MKTLEQTIAELQRQPYETEDYLVRSDQLIQSAVYYLTQYASIRHLLIDDLVGYSGHNPVVKIGEKYFAVREYIPTERSWRCHQVEISPITQTWVCCADENFVIDNSGKILYREVGWDLRKEPWKGE